MQRVMVTIQCSIDPDDRESIEAGRKLMTERINATCDTLIEQGGAAKDFASLYAVNQENEVELLGHQEFDSDEAL